MKSNIFKYPYITSKILLAYKFILLLKFVTFLLAGVPIKDGPLALFRELGPQIIGVYLKLKLSS